MTVVKKLLDGLKAAMVLVGLVILFGFAASISPWRDFFHVGYFGIHKIFVTVILLGLLVGWCFSAKVKKYCPARVVAYSTVLFLATNLFLAIGEHKLTPNEIKLADCSGNIVNIHLIAPKGRHYVLDLKGPLSGYTTNGGCYISSYKFTGHLWITDGESQTTDIPLDSDKVPAFPGELILGPVNLEEGKDYDLKIEFNPPPPPSSFVSLHWMQNYADRN